MQLGLGAAALTKFCCKKLRMKTTAIELNPQVVAACRLLVQAAGRRRPAVGGAGRRRREVAAHAHWRGTVDALQVDLYDHEAAAPVLDSEDFYADCRALLTEDGCMTVNLFGRSSSYERSLREDRGGLRRRSGLGVPADARGQHRGAGPAHAAAARPRAALAERAETIETRWGLPARKWLRVFKPADPA